MSLLCSFDFRSFVAHQILNLWNGKELGDEFLRKCIQPHHLTWSWILYPTDLLWWCDIVWINFDLRLLDSRNFRFFRQNLSFWPSFLSHTQGVERIIWKFINAHEIIVSREELAGLIRARMASHKKILLLYISFKIANPIACSLAADRIKLPNFWWQD